jgi:hypothetical protein
MACPEEIGQLKIRMPRIRVCDAVFPRETVRASGRNYAATRKARAVGYKPVPRAGLSTQYQPRG